MLVLILFSNKLSCDFIHFLPSAGDYVKFNFPISSSATLLAWGLAQWRDSYQAAGQLDEMLDLIRWPMDYFLKCWRSDDLEYYAQVSCRPKEKRTLILYITYA